MRLKVFTTLHENLSLGSQFFCVLEDCCGLIMGKKWCLSGKIVSGVKQGAFFTQLDWFQEQCLEKLGFKPYAGTLNLEISVGDVPKVEDLEKRAEIEFIPPDSTFCSGKAYPVMVENLRAAIVMPAKEVRVHGENIIELIAPLRLKDSLNISDGDLVTLTIVDSPPIV